MVASRINIPLHILWALGLLCVANYHQTHIEVTEYSFTWQAGELWTLNKGWCEYPLNWTSDARAEAVLTVEL